VFLEIFETKIGSLVIGLLVCNQVLSCREMFLRFNVKPTGSSSFSKDGMLVQRQQALGSDAWLQIPVLLLVGCVSLDKLFNLSENYSPHLEIKIVSAL